MLLCSAAKGMMLVLAVNQQGSLLASECSQRRTPLCSAAGTAAVVMMRPTERMGLSRSGEVSAHSESVKLVPADLQEQGLFVPRQVLGVASLGQLQVALVGLLVMEAQQLVLAAGLERELGDRDDHCAGSKGGLGPLQGLSKQRQQCCHSCTATILDEAASVINAYLQVKDACIQWLLVK